VKLTEGWARSQKDASVDPPAGSLPILGQPSNPNILTQTKSCPQKKKNPPRSTPIRTKQNYARFILNCKKGKGKTFIN